MIPPLPPLPALFMGFIKPGDRVQPDSIDFVHPVQRPSPTELGVFCWHDVEMIYRGLIIRIRFEIAI